MSGYILYARKSSESEDRQVLSIESQVRELEAHARSMNLRITLVLQESRSAKAPGRDVFGRMLQEVSRGKADGILCWKLDRLARNPIDGAALIWAIDTGKLQQIVTREKSFTNKGDDKFWMQLEFGMAKKYVDDLSDNVKRGNRAKLQLGWLPGLPPLGYQNDPVSRTIVKDSERFDLVRKMWDLVLAGRSPIDVLRIAADEWGLRTRKFRRIGGKPVARANFYRMLSNPFYYGLIARHGDAYPGKHPAMISEDEFDRVQELLGRPNRKHAKRHRFAFTGLIRCGECSASITAEEKMNRYGSHYTYYHCTKRKTAVPCGQGAIRRERLEEQIEEALTRIKLNDAFTAWALGNLRIVHDNETGARQAMDRSIVTSLAATQEQIDRLLELRLRGLVTDDEYRTKKEALVSTELRLRERRGDAEGRATRWLDLTEKAFVFANEAPKRFREGSREEKREILVALGSNLILENGFLRIQAQKPFRMIEGEVRHLLAKRRPFEPQLRDSRAQQNGDAVAAVPSWCTLVDGMRTFFDGHPTLIQWPKFCERRNVIKGKNAIYGSKIAGKASTA